MTNLFAYGTLIHQGVVDRIMGPGMVLEPAVLPNHTRINRHGLWWARPSSEDTLEGVVIRNLNDNQLARTRAYEANLYDETPVTAIVSASGEEVDCIIYMDKTFSLN